MASGSYPATAVSPDGRLVAGGDAEGDIHLWELATGKEVLKLRAKSKTLRSVVFAPDGRRLAAAGGECEVGTIQVWDPATGRQVFRFRDACGCITSLAFSRAGDRLVSGMSNGTALVWDTSRHDKAPEARLSPGALDRLWKDLGGGDAVAGRRAVWALASAPGQAVPFLRERLRPVAVPDPRRFARLIADLDGDRFAVRERASRELEGLGEAARADLRKVLAGRPSLEVRRRVEGLLAKLREGPFLSGPKLRAERAVEVLEHAGTPAAPQVLAELSRGAAEARLTLSAQAALERLRMRAISSGSSARPDR